MPLRLFLIVKDPCRNLSYAQNCERGTVSLSDDMVNSVNLFFDEIQVSGDDRARTDNLRLARAALSQLSYVPGFIGPLTKGPEENWPKWQVSHWTWEDSNLRPQLYQSCDLTS